MNGTIKYQTNGDFTFTFNLMDMIDQLSPEDIVAKKEIERLEDALKKSEQRYYELLAERRSHGV